jgi:hypothetical protein
MNELRTKLHHFALIPERPYSATDTVAGFKHEHLAPGFGKAPSRSEPRHTGADHKDALSCFPHIGLDAPAILQHMNSLADRPNLI